ncbi:regulatory protein RecX [Endozoicomonadaceae bacterium StTr2]
MDINVRDLDNSDEQLAPKVRLSAMNLLARREYSRAELRLRLVRKYPFELVEQTLDRLVAEKLQSDERFTESFVRQWLNKGYGPMRIRQELKLREVDEALVNDYLVADDELWIEQAIRMLEKRFGKSSGKTDKLAELKQMKYLQQRGFSYQHIRQAMRQSEGHDE